MPRDALCKCGSRVPLTMDTRDLLGGFSHICPECRTIVAVAFKGKKYALATVMKPSWNDGLKQRAVPIGKDILFSVCTDGKNMLLVEIMQLMAKREGAGFRYLYGNQKAGLCFDPVQDKYVGYILWSENKHAIARQLFIMPDKRRKGFASRLFKYWVTNYANRIAKKFGAETPNEISQKILAKLGYAKFKDKSLVGVKCFFVPSI